MGAASMKIWCSCCSSSCCDGGSDMLLHAIWMVVSSDIGTAVWIRANGMSCGAASMRIWYSCCSSSYCDGGNDMLLHAVFDGGVKIWHSYRDSL